MKQVIQQNTYSVKNVLALAYASIKEHGWVSRAQSNETECLSTADRVLEFIENSTKISEDAEFNANRVISYWKKLEVSDNNYYQTKVKALIEKDEILYFDIALLASAVGSYQNSMKLKLKQMASAPVGTVGEKIKNLPVRVEATRAVVTPGFNHFSGVVCRTAIEFVDEEGNVYTWLSSKYLEVEKGSTWLISGTIKGHTSFKDVEQTQLTRVKMLELVK